MIYLILLKSLKKVGYCFLTKRTTQKTIRIRSDLLDFLQKSSLGQIMPLSIFFLLIKSHISDRYCCMFCHSLHVLSKICRISFFYIWTHLSYSYYRLTVAYIVLDILQIFWIFWIFLHIFVILFCIFIHLICIQFCY